MSILEVHDVSIRYMTGDFKDIGLKEYVMRKLKGEYRINEFWADRNVTFSLEKGDMLGIIGTNGAGKSTLLKAISGIMEPTGGWVKREGNIAALLELASGFDGELTVRENTYLRGAMLGYTRKFMDEMYGKIIEFAELEEFQDRPFKQLSSGMKSRLAFSIASLVQPDILVLGKALTGGYIGHAATVARKRVFDGFYDEHPEHALMHGPTFMGNALACSVALKSIELFETGDYMSKIKRIEAVTRREMEGFTDPRIREIRIMGGCVCAEVTDASVLKGYQQFAFERGVFSRPFLNCLYAMVPYVIREEELVKVLDTMKAWFRV